jgi:Uma2 family endonuclease
MPSGTIDERVLPDEYLAREACAETRSEYVSGTLRAMAGASPEHVAICFNLTRDIGSHVRGSACRGAGGDQRVWIEACDKYYYPDLSITCGSPQFELRQNLRSLVNPTIIFEVVSPSTEAIDRGEKLTCYQKIQSLQAYVLISQNVPRVEVYARIEGDRWTYSMTEGLDAEVTLPAASCTLLLADLYEDVDFHDAPD